MSDFASFVHEMGLDVRYVESDGKIHRCKTFDKPHKQNGAYRYFGHWGWSMNWSQHTDPVYWNDGQPGTEKLRQQDMQRINAVEAAEKRHAIERAREIVNRCKMDRHPYLVKKGFETHTGLVDVDGRLVIPIWADGGLGKLTSVQWIDDAGEKMFLSHGAVKGSGHRLGARQGVRWIAEGIATSLSLLAALKASYQTGSVTATFFASNLVTVAKAQRIPGNLYVFADNDAPNPQTGKRAGEEAAIASGLPYVMSPTVGFDANDEHQKNGINAVIDLMKSVKHLPLRD